jgi:ABC-type glycerol-3-phosphate transport system substrate-binding protein
MRINHRPRRGPQPLSGLAAAAVLFASTGSAGAWTLQEASAPYRGTTIRVVGLDRPSYDAMKQLIPDFEKTTGINVKVVTYRMKARWKPRLWTSHPAPMTMT